MRKAKTTEEFIKRANKIHNFKYNYSLVTYTHSEEKIPIICSDHGIFSQVPYNHLRGLGCPKCGNIKISKALKTSVIEFVNQANVIHNNKYDYSKIEEFESRTPVPIICSEHGIFYQRADSHLAGRGCSKCGHEKRGYTKEDFIKNANEIHNFKYNYDLVDFKKTNEYINIICLDHGSFNQRLNHHLRGHGCPHCVSLVSKPETNWLNSLKIENLIKQKNIQIDKKRFKVDGFDPLTNTIYEFLGDFWHGNPNKFNPLDVNPITKTTFKHLFDKTEQRLKIFKNAGYKVVSIWESDFLASCQSQPN